MCFLYYFINKKNCIDLMFYLKMAKNKINKKIIQEMDNCCDTY